MDLPSQRVEDVGRPVDTPLRVRKLTSSLVLIRSQGRPFGYGARPDHRAKTATSHGYELRSVRQNRGRGDPHCQAQGSSSRPVVVTCVDRGMDVVRSVHPDVQQLRGAPPQYLNWNWNRPLRVPAAESPHRSRAANSTVDCAITPSAGFLPSSGNCHTGEPR